MEPYTNLSKKPTHRSVNACLVEFVRVQFDLNPRVTAVAFVPPVGLGFPPFLTRAPYQRTEPVMVIRGLLLSSILRPILTAIHAHAAVADYQRMRMVATTTIVTTTNTIAIG